MGPYLSYNIITAIFIAVLYLSYKIVLSSQKAPTLNRTVILASICLAWIAPVLMSMDLSMFTPQTIGNGEIAVDLLSLGIENQPQYTTPLWFYVVSAVYLCGVGVTTILTIVQLTTIRKIIRESRVVRHPGCTVAVTRKENIAPFSWRGYVVMSEKDYDTAQSLILTHELGHIRHHHSLDLIVMQLFCCLQWFNPAIWLFRSELHAVHEYQADNDVLNAGINIKDYQTLLIKKAIGTRFQSLANSLNHNNLKKRIIMMYKVKNKAPMLRALALMPAIAAAIGICNTPTLRAAINSVESQSLSISALKEPSAESTTIITVNNASTAAKVAPSAVNTTVESVPSGKVTKKSANLSADKTESTLDLQKIDKQAEFPGGMKALMKTLSDLIKYPKSAQENGVQGVVIVKFTIDANGNVKEPQVLKGVVPELDNEAMRVISQLPQWIPAQSQGRNVATSFVLPIKFGMVKELSQAEFNKRVASSTLKPTVFINGKLFDGDPSTISPQTIKSINFIKNDPEYPDGKMMIELKE